MSIERTLAPFSVPTVTLQSQDLRIRPGTEDTSSEKITSKGTPDTRIKLSKVVQDIQKDTSHDIDYDRIAKIRASMDAGDLQFDPDMVANALIEDIFQLP